LQRALKDANAANITLLSLLIGPLQAIEQDRAAENKQLREDNFKLRQQSQDNLLQQQLLELERAKHARAAETKDKAIAALSQHMPAMFRIMAKKVGVEGLDVMPPDAAKPDPELGMKAAIADGLLAKLKALDTESVDKIAALLGGPEGDMLRDLKQGM